MNSATQFLVAKYIPDLRRMEPRNFGVITWSASGIAAKFVGESAEQVSKIQPPSFVKSKSAYRQWVRYWREIISRPEFRGDDGQFVERKDPQFVDLLISKSKPQYSLARSGEFLKEISRDELKEVTDELFEELVTNTSESKSTAHAEASRLLSAACNRAIRESGLKDQEGFSSGFDWSCDVKGERVPMHFDYAIHRGKHPNSLMERVKLWSPGDVYKTAFEFDAMRTAYDIKQENCIAMIYPTEEDDSSNESKSLCNMLGKMVTVVDMRDEKNAAARLAKAASLSI